MQRKDSLYDARCWKCQKSIVVGEEMFYDALAARGQRSYCVPCGETAASTTSKPKPQDDAAAELAALRRKLADMEAQKPMPAPIPVPKPSVSDNPLAAAIAAAVEPLIAGKLDESRVLEIVKAYMTPPTHTITVVTPEAPEGVKMGRQHRQFEELLLMCSARHQDGSRLNIQLTGPAGSGKSRAAKAVAIALKLDFCLVPTLVESHKFFGHISPSSDKYVATAARKVWEHGGILCLDDFDGTEPVVGVELLAIRNGGMAFPDGYVERHPDCIVIMTCNTWGNGATSEFVGRFKQDGAWTDGFVALYWDYDEQLESDTSGNSGWAKRVQQIRARAFAKGMKVMITPRATYFGAALLRAGMKQERVEAVAIRKSMTEEHWRSICAAN